MLTDQEVIAQRNSAEMIRRCHLWPHSVLPLKRTRKDDDPLWYDTAVIVSVTPCGKVAVVEGTTIFGPISEEPRQVLYDSPEAVVAAGWVVD
jgi:hypothetical protein